MNQHLHILRPFHTLNRVPMLGCDCGRQINCARNPQSDGHNLMVWNRTTDQLQANIIRESRDD